MGSPFGDVLRGNGARNRLKGLEGADKLYGLGGVDPLRGGDGNDNLYGGSGDDTLIRGWGTDRIRGGAGNDVLQGKAGNDSVFGENGDDTIEGNLADDLLDGGDGTDTLKGGAGSDTCHSGEHYVSCELPLSASSGVAQRPDHSEPTARDFHRRKGHDRPLPSADKVRVPRGPQREANRHGGHRRIVRLWRAADGAEVLTISGSDGWIGDARFLPDDTRILTGAFDGHVRIYTLDVNELVTIARSRMTRTLTHAECETYHSETCG